MSREPEVDHEHRAAAAGAGGQLDHAQTDDGQRAGGARHHDVEFFEGIGQLVQAQRAAVELACELFAALLSAVGHHDGLGVLGREVRGAQFDHFAGADEQHPGFAQVFEDAPGQPDRGSRHRHRMRTDLGGGAHFLGDRERSLEQLAGVPANRRLATRPLHLPRSGFSTIESGRGHAKAWRQPDRWAARTSAIELPRGKSPGDAPAIRKWGTSPGCSVAQ
jgi:hypothetical protein